MEVIGSAESRRKSEKCMEYMEKYYRRNYHILSSRNGDGELLDELEMVLEKGNQLKNPATKTNRKYDPCMTFVIYGNKSSKFDKRPTRRAYIAPACSICIKTIKLNDYA